MRYYQGFQENKLWLRKLPWIFIIAIYISVIWVDMNHKFWRTTERVIFWDVKNYYAYLPATFIYHDIGMNFKDDDPEKFANLIWTFPTEKGMYTNKMSMGLSFAYAPFFFMAHAVAEPLGYEADGYSLPYRFFLVMSSGIYLLLGMMFLFYILKRWFNPWVVSLTILGVTVGTNLFFYATIESAMTHAYSFALFAAFLLLTIKWYEKPGWAITILMGLLAGWISLIRPTNIVIVFIFVLWGIKNTRDFRQRVNDLLQSFPKIGLMVVMAALVWVPQFLYWKYTTGSWVYYSYNDEGFFFDNPAIIQGLFSYRKGWLLYTPIMAFALAGIWFMRKRLPGAFLSTLVFTVVNIYVVLSWWSWWYGGSFGLRAFIESYAILALPLAVMIDILLKRKLWVRIISITVFVALLSHSVFQTMQYYYGSIHWDSMTKEAYWDSFLRLRPSGEFYEKLDPPETLQEALERNGKRGND